MKIKSFVFLGLALFAGILLVVLWDTGPGRHLPATPHLPAVLSKREYLHILLDQALKTDDTCSDAHECIAITAGRCHTLFGATSIYNKDLDLAQSHARQIEKESEEEAYRLLMANLCNTDAQAIPAPYCEAGHCVIDGARHAGMYPAHVFSGVPRGGPGISHPSDEANLIKGNVPLDAKFYFSVITPRHSLPLVIDYGDGTKDELNLSGTRACDERDCGFFMNGEAAHSYASAGNFEAKILEKNGTILAVTKVAALDNKDAFFHANVSQGAAPLEVIFKVGNDANMTYTIEFGDGESETVHVGDVYHRPDIRVSMDEFKHTYKTSGTYKAILHWGDKRDDRQKETFEHIQIRVLP